MKIKKGWCPHCGMENVDHLEIEIKHDFEYILMCEDCLKKLFSALEKNKVKLKDL